MIENLRDRGEIRRTIEAIPAAVWSVAMRDLSARINDAILAGTIDDATCEVWGEEIARRQDRTAQSASSVHDRFEGQSPTFRSTVHPIEGLIRRMCEVGERLIESELRSLPPDRKRRGPSKFDPGERRARRLQSKGQAKMAKCPEEIWRHYDLAEASALSIVLLDIAETGECTRPIERIAGAAKVSRRTVQTMIRRAKRRGELLVESRTDHTRRTIPSRITLVSAEILAYQQRYNGRDQTQIFGSPSFFDSISEQESPLLEGANSFTHPYIEDDQVAEDSPRTVAVDATDPEAKPNETAVQKARGTIRGTHVARPPTTSPLEDIIARWGANIRARGAEPAPS